MTADRKRYRRKKAKIKRLLLKLGICAVGITILASAKHLISINKRLVASVTNAKEVVNSSGINLINAHDLYSSNAILVSLEDDQVLLDKGANQSIYPASLTKIMTAIVAIEELGDLDQTIELSQEMFERLYTENASMAGFSPNEKVKAIDLIYGVLLPSGAESCIGLAEAITGSEKEYVKLMNEKAEELGMNNTHFTNATGLHHDNHYSTVNDMARLLEYALQNDTFREVYTSKQYTTGATDIHSEGITFESTMFKKMDTEEINNGVIRGGKTGYTDEAKLCLASLAEIDDKEYILVTARADGSPYTEQFNILDAFTVYNQIFENDIY